MSVKSVSVKSLFGLLLLAFIGGAYLYHLSPAERWLLFWEAEAQTYANAKLEKRAIPKEMSDDFIDILTVTDPKKRTVLFSPHSNHEITVVYAPDSPSENLVYENMTANRIRKNWYALP